MADRCRSYKLKMKFVKSFFPTQLHSDAAETVSDYFLKIPAIDTVLIVNSCARGHAVAESDLDMAILVKEETPQFLITRLYKRWFAFAEKNAVIQSYKRSNAYAHLHLDIINGKYKPGNIENGEPIDYFEVEIGNQVCYAAPINNYGKYFKKLEKEWLPYYKETIRKQRLKNILDACRYDLDHIPYLVKRELYFHAVAVLFKAFEEYLQALFIANRVYPLAYNKWIKYQVTELLNKPELYPKLPPVLSIKSIESNNINRKARLLHKLLDAI